MGSFLLSAHGLFLFLSVQAVEGSAVPKAKIAKETKTKRTTLLLRCHHRSPNRNIFFYNTNFKKVNRRAPVTGGCGPQDW
jgi:hypothetical protein